MITDISLDGLRRQRPEWEPWLVVVEDILLEVCGTAWDAVIPEGTQTPRTAAVPLLSGSRIVLDSRSIRRLLDRLIRVASKVGTPQMATLKAALKADIEMASLYTASLCQDNDRIEELAAISGADPAALQAIIALLPIPLLYACNRRWSSSISPGWMEGYCPVCGSWPVFAEVRGIERNRFFRCGRCAGEWHARALHCPYCAMTDHNELVVLVPEQGSSNGVIEACQRCLGYVKTFTRLQGCPPEAVMLEDLASVDLDVAALEHGFGRPSTPGYSLGITVIDEGPRKDEGSRKRIFAWKS